jgi:hypothetical protein
MGGSAPRLVWLEFGPRPWVICVVLIVITGETEGALGNHHGSTSASLGPSTSDIITPDMVRHALEKAYWKTTDFSHLTGLRTVGLKGTPE